MTWMEVTAVAGYDPDQVRKTVAGNLDRSGLDWAGKKVLVKPNLLGPWTPDTAVVTHPSLIRAVREELRARGCEVLVGDNPGVRGYGKIGDTAEATGARDASGEDFANISRHPRSVDLKSKYSKSVSVSSEVLDVDLWISLPKFKTHMSTILTGAVKNSYGILVGAEKARLHAAAPRPRDFGELVVDVYSLRPPDLVILDAVVGMEGNGPSAGKPREMGYILASNSGGAIDLAMCHMAGIDPSRLTTHGPAVKRDLAPSSLDEVEVGGGLPVIDGFRSPSSMARLDPFGLGQRLLFGRISRPRLQADREKCNACGTCAESCPVEAITMEKYPVFDRGKCISCYCCHEMCPKAAIKVGRLLGFIRERK
jgi:uncharacterized protein (DUF362 family)/Pyruvate/2-oxoacid:ferredoxin oxidoreductase delta subunit